MFHNSTTIRHNFNPTQSLFKEKRMAYGALDDLKAAADKVTRGTSKAFSKIGGATQKIYKNRLVKWSLFPATSVIGAGMKVIGLGMDGTEIAIRTGAEVGKGIGKEMILDTGLELAKAPVNCVKKTLLHNFRDIFKGIFKLPVNVVKAPFRFAGSLWKYPKKVFEGIAKTASNTRSRVSEVLGNISNLKPFSAINSTRKAITGTLYDTIKEPLLSPLKTVFIDPVAPVFEMPRDVIRNVVSAHLEYPVRIYNAPGHIIKGGKTVWNAPSKAMSDFRASKAQMAAANDDKEKKPEVKVKARPNPIDDEMAA